jgi:hypothetical protein
MTAPTTLKEWIQTIEDEVMYVNVKPYSHNIIGFALRAIANNYGDEEANKVIEDLDLERLGWHKVVIDVNAK